MVQRFSTWSCRDWAGRPQRSASCGCPWLAVRLGFYCGKPAFAMCNAPAWARPAAFPTSSNLSLSPDGSRLAIISAEKGGRIQLLTLATRQIREIVVKGWTELRNVDWSADGRTLFVPATKDERTVA